jgi:hypothetical protein
MIHEPDTVLFCTDGSGIDGHIGAAAHCPHTSETKQQYLGMDSTQNVYVAELYAVKLAIDMALELPIHYRKSFIYLSIRKMHNTTCDPSKVSFQSLSHCIPCPFPDDEVARQIV